MNILDKIVLKTRERCASLETELLRDRALLLHREDFPFEKALTAYSGIKIIAEIKKASPSKGVIAEDFNPKLIAEDYKAADVDCISVLTEPYFFSGDNSYVKIAKSVSGKPILRKDFILCPAQIYEAKIIGADCILLICAILDKNKLKNFLEIAGELGLSALVEAHDENEIKMAVDAGAKIIGVNNRDLKTFEINFENSLNLRKFVPEGIIFVSESGIKTRQDVEVLSNAGVQAVLIGETFMRAEDKPFQIKKLRGMV